MSAAPNRFKQANVSPSGSAVHAVFSKSGEATSVGPML